MEKVLTDWSFAHFEQILVLNRHSTFRTPGAKHVYKCTISNISEKDGW